MYRATVYKVMIASPSDVEQERGIVRRAIHEWNVIHSHKERIVLLPVGWETHCAPSMDDRPQAVINKQVLADCDLLIAVFWTRLGTPTGEAISGTVEEIEEHLQAGRPAMLYFSSAPVSLDSVDQEQYQALVGFRESCQQRGLVERFETSAVFENKIRRQLAQTVNRHFMSSEDSGRSTREARSDAPVPDSESARELLIEASKDRDGHILRVRTASGRHVQTNGRDFVLGGDPRSAAKWDGAVDKLIGLGLIKQSDSKGEVFGITDQGYEVVSRLE